MDVAITIVMLVPVLLAVALIIGVIRRNITERQAGDPVDISGAIPAVIVLMVAVLIIVAMGNAASPYVYDEDSGELKIQQNVPELDVQPWDSYASEVKSLVIEDGVSIGSGAFDSLTSLDYVSIGENSTIGAGAFGVTFQDYMEQSMEAVAGEYVGDGDGVLYYADSSIYTYNSAGYLVSLTASASQAKIVILPIEHEGRTVVGIRTGAFQDNSSIERVMVLPGDYSGMTDISTYAFKGCSALVSAEVPDSIKTLGTRTFYQCSSLESVDLPDSLETIGGGAFATCTSLASVEIPASVTRIEDGAFDSSGIQSIDLPDSLETIGYRTFYQCSSLESVSFPASLTSIAGEAFRGCTGTTSVSFAAGFSPEMVSSAFQSWTFYASDGTTTIDKTDAAALAGKTFQGTAAALVEVSPGLLSLTPQQLQQVQLHTQELQQQELDIQPLPFQPTVQTQDLEPVSA